MRILLEHGEHQHRNRGDVAMLQVTVQRLRDLWPGAEIAVVTGDPVRLAELVPDAIPVQLRRGRGMWFRRAGTVDPLKGVHVLVAVGGGYLTDVDPEQTRRVLECMRAAQARGIPTVMFGQGIGPLTDPELRELAADVLPDADLITLREGVEGVGLLVGLGVRGDRVLVTGDDAIPLGRADAPAALGLGLGVNHRVARYMDTGEDDTHVIREAVHAAAYHHQAPLVALPVSEWDDDRPGTARITDGYPMVEQPEGREAPPRWILRRLDRTRVVVTTTYHLAVFALSRGIPAVCVSASEYYRLKFTGLAGQFGDGCSVVDLRDGDDDGGRIVEAVDDLWVRAEQLRPALLRAADRQMASGDAAYRRARELVESRLAGR